MPVLQQLWQPDRLRWELRTKGGMMRVYKGLSLPLPLIHHPQPDDMVIEVLQEGGEGLTIPWSLEFDCKHLKKLGFVIADDSEILSNEVLRRQPLGTRLGLDFQRTSKRQFLKPIRKIVARERERGRKSRPSLSARWTPEFFLRSRVDKIFREETVFVRRKDSLYRMSTRCCMNMKEYLARIGLRNQEIDDKDAETLKRAKELVWTFKRTPIFLAKSNPFPKKAIKYVEVDEMEQSESESFSDLDFLDSEELKHGHHHMPISATGTFSPSGTDLQTDHSHWQQT